MSPGRTARFAVKACGPRAADVSLVDPVDPGECPSDKEVRSVGHHEELAQWRGGRVVLGRFQNEGTPDALPMQQASVWEAP